MKPKLSIIRETHRPVVDIYADWRAEIAAIDWSETHIRGDKRQPIELGDSRKGWAR